MIGWNDLPFEIKLIILDDVFGYILTLPRFDLRWCGQHSESLDLGEDKCSSCMSKSVQWSTEKTPPYFLSSPYWRRLFDCLYHTFHVSDSGCGDKFWRCEVLRRTILNVVLLGSDMRSELEAKVENMWRKQKTVKWVPAWEKPQTEWYCNCARPHRCSFVGTFLCWLRR